MYSIGVIVFGVPISEKLLDSIGQLKPSDLPELHNEFSNKEIASDYIRPTDLLEIVTESCFETAYHGSSHHIPGWCGVVLSEFSDTCAAMKLSTLMVQPTQKQKDEAIAKIQQLPVAIRAIADEPDVYIVWTTS